MPVIPFGAATAKGLKLLGAPDMFANGVGWIAVAIKGKLTGGVSLTWDVPALIAEQGVSGASEVIIEGLVNQGVDTVIQEAIKNDPVGMAELLTKEWSADVAEAVFEELQEMDK